MNWRIIILIVAVIIILLSSCSEQKRCARYVRKHPECFHIDTIWRDSIQKGWEIDTFWQVSIHESSRVDTFTMIKDNIVVKTVVKWKDRIIYQNVQKRDTVVKYATVYRTVPVTTKKLPLWVILVIGVEGLVILLQAIGRVKSS